jgi:hypothetical protein
MATSKFFWSRYGELKINKKSNNPLLDLLALFFATRLQKFAKTKNTTPYG